MNRTATSNFRPELGREVPDLDYDPINSNGSLFHWPTSMDHEELAEEYVFDRTEVRVALVFVYTLVFTCCFLGNLLVIIVVAVHRRMRTVTNFFLTNLAFADLCVGVFCVYQNLSIYLSNHWAFGEVLCKMYHFVHSLSYTASVAILTVICIERYVAIVHPIWSKQVLTIRRLRFVIVLVWVSSAAYCSPRLIVYGTIEIPSRDGEMETICVMKRALYNSLLYDIINFLICFLVPLLVMSVMYFIIGLRLWCSSYPEHNRNCALTYRLRPVHSRNVQLKAAKARSVFCCSSSNPLSSQEYGSCETSTNGDCNHETRDTEMLSNVATMQSTSVYHGKENCHVVVATTVLIARRRAIRLLVTVVLSFAVCNLPFHARKFWQYWSPHYQGGSNQAVFLTIATTLILYLNSGINPIIYAFLSDNFRKSMSDVIKCRVHKNIARQASVKSTYNRTLQSSVGHPDATLNKR